MNNLFRWAFAAVVMASLAACASPTRDAEDAERAAEADRTADADTRAMEADARYDAAALDDPDSLLSERLVYFAFDRDEVKPEFMDMLEEHAAYLAANPGAELRLEGHTDERGTREYNLGLGERRAKAVERVLTLNGASSDQVEIISYGEEMPVAFGQNEEAWAENRRVELVYESRQ